MAGFEEIFSDILGEDTTSNVQTLQRPRPSAEQPKTGRTFEEIFSDVLTPETQVPPVAEQPEIPPPVEAEQPVELPEQISATAEPEISAIPPPMPGYGSFTPPVRTAQPKAIKPELPSKTEPIETEVTESPIAGQPEIVSPVETEIPEMPERITGRIPEQAPTKKIPKIGVLPQGHRNRFSWMDSGKGHLFLTYNPDPNLKGDLSKPEISSESQAIPYGIDYIDLSQMPKVKNNDDTILSTITSTSINENGKEVLIPTVRHGLDRVMSDQEAVDWYHKSGEYLGKFDNTEDAAAFAKELSNKQEAQLFSDTLPTKEPTAEFKPEPEPKEDLIPPPMPGYGSFAPPVRTAQPKAEKKMGLPEAMARSFGAGAAELALNFARTPQTAAEVYLSLNNLTNRALNTGIKKVTGKEKVIPEIPLESVPDLLNEESWDTKAVRKFAENQRNAIKEATNSKGLIDNLAAGNFSEAGKEIGIQTAAQIPLMLSMIGGGFAGTSAKVLGGFAGAIQTSREMDQYWQDVEKGIAKQSPEAAGVNALINGVIETLGETFVTGNIINDALKTIANKSSEDVAKKVVGNAVGNVVGKMLNAFQQEATEEAVVNYSQAVMDRLFGKRDVTLLNAVKEGVEAGIIGGFTAAGTTGPLTGYAQSRRGPFTEFVDEKTGKVTPIEKGTVAQAAPQGQLTEIVDEETGEVRPIGEIPGGIKPKETEISEVEQKAKEVIQPKPKEAEGGLQGKTETEVKKADLPSGETVTEPAVKEPVPAPKEKPITKEIPSAKEIGETVTETGEQDGVKGGEKGRIRVRNYEKGGVETGEREKIKTPRGVSAKEVTLPKPVNVNSPNYEPILDLNKKPTGWIRPKNNPSVIVNPNTKQQITFIANKPEAATAPALTRTAATGYAMNNPAIQKEKAAKSATEIVRKRIGLETDVVEEGNKPILKEKISEPGETNREAPASPAITTKGEVSAAKAKEEKKEVTSEEKSVRQRLEAQQKRGRTVRAKSRRPASVKRIAEEKEYSPQYWKAQHGHHLNVYLYNALKDGWTDRAQTDHPGRQKGWVDDYNIITDSNVPGGTKNPVLSDNAKQWLQEVVDNIAENPDYIQELNNIGISQPKNIDDVITLLKSSMSAAEFISFHNNYEKKIREADVDQDQYDEALRVFNEEPYNLTPDQRTVLEKAWGATVEDVIAREREELKPVAETKGMPKEDQKKKAEEEGYDIIDGTGVVTKGYSGAQSNEAMGLTLEDESDTGKKTISKHRISEKLSELGKVPIRVGRYRGKRKLGIFKVRPREIRVREAGNIPVIAHEVGHSLERDVFENIQFDSDKWREIRKELTALGKALYGKNRPANGYASEGWAEYWNYYFAKDSMLDKYAPATNDYVKNSFLKNNPDFQKKVDEIKSLVEGYKKQGALKRAEAQIEEEKGKGAIRQTVEAINKENLIDEAAGIESAINRMNAIKTENIAAYQKKMEMLDAWKERELKKNPSEEKEKLILKKYDHFRAKYQTAINDNRRELSTSKNPYKSVQALRRIAPARVKYMAENGMIDFNGRIVGRPLKDAASIVRKYKNGRRSFENYLYARRAQEYHRLGLDPGLDLKAANYTVEKYENKYPDFAIAAKIVHDWNRGLLDYANKAGAISDDVVAKIKNKWDFYFPFERVSPYQVSSLQQKKGSKIVERAKGSGKAIRRPFDTMLKSAEHIIDATHQRYVLDRLFELKDVEGIGEIMVEVPKDQIPNTFPIEQIKAQLEEKGVDLEGVDLDDMITTFTSAQRAKNGEPIIAKVERVTEKDNNGKSVQKDKVKWYYVDENLYEAINGMNKVNSISPLADFILGKPARMYKMGTTGIRASFSPRNAMKDFGVALIQSAGKKNPKVLLDYLTNTIKSDFNKLLEIGGGKANEFNDLFDRLGLPMSQALGIDIKHTKRASKELFQGKVERMIKNPIDALRDIIQITEGGTRVAAIEKMVKERKIDINNMTTDEMFDLIIEGSQVTTDFRAMGKWIRNWNAIVPFLNANIHGKRQFLRTWKKNPAASIVIGLATMTLPALLNWFKNKDEEWYKGLPFFEKFLYENVQIGDNILRVPKAHEWALVFQTIPTMIIDAAYNKDPEAVKELFRNIISNEVPQVTPHVLNVLFEQLHNKVDFTKRPIVSRGDIDKPGPEQYGPYTSNLSIGLANMFKQLNLSPDRIDHIIRNAFGGVGQDVLAATRREKSTVKELANIPVVGSFFRWGGKYTFRNRYIDEYYELYDKYKKLVNSKDFKENPDVKDIFQMITTANDELKVFREMYKEVETKDDRLEVAKDATDAIKSFVEQIKNIEESIEIKAQDESEE